MLFRSAATTADPREATLRERGFSAEVRPDGQDPPTYDYTRVSQASPWKAFVGSFTRTGDVLPLLTTSDDHFVIAKTGDELSLEFDAPPASVPPGWTRTYLLRGDEKLLGALFLVVGVLVWAGHAFLDWRRIPNLSRIAPGAIRARG